MKIREIDNYNDFLTLKEEWTGLLKRCEHTVFSTWEWLSTWWKHFGKDKKLLIILAEDQNKLIGIAPLMYSVHKMLGLRIRKIEFIGTPQSDYGDFVLAEKEEECLKAFTNHILNNFPEKWDCIELKEIPETAKTLILLKNMTEKIRIASTRILHECPYMPLPQSVDVLLSRLNYKFKKNLRRGQRQLEQRYKVEFTDYSSPQIFKEGMMKLFELHQKRWKLKGETGVFADQEICNFHLDVAEFFSRLGWLSLDSISADGKTIACLYGFKYGSKLYYYLSGADPTYNKYSPGNLLIFSVLQKCIKEGLIEFDFLRGEEPYKSRWTPLSRRNSNVVLIRRGVFPWLREWVARKYWFQGSLLKNLLNLR